MRSFLPLLRLALLLAAVACVALTLGRYGLGASELWAWVRGTVPEGEGGRWYNIFVTLRLSRIAAAALVGAALAVSGGALQALFGNPLVSPNLCGALSGSAFGAAVAMTLGASWGAVQAATFAGGLVAVAGALLLARLFRHAGQPVLLLILGGIVANAFFAALLAIVKYLADPYDKLPAIVFWLMGSFSRVEWAAILRVAAPMLAALLALVALGGRLNVLSLGDESARTLGLPVGRLRLLVIALATLLCALTVVLAGEVGWVGLIVPHAARVLVGPDNRVLLPASGLLGAVLLVAVDTFARTAFRIEVPVGILTALVGVVVFVALFGRVRKGWA